MSHHWSELPRPFFDDWSRQRRAAGQALWNWHLGLLDVQPITRNGAYGVEDEIFVADQQRATRGEPVHLLREPVWSAAYGVCEEFGLSRELLAKQLGAAKMLVGPIRFEDQQALEAFVRRWAIPHTRLLAGLANAAHSWQLRPVDELARGFFYVGRLMSLPEDLAEDQLFIPLEDLEQSGVDVEQLRTGTMDEGVRRLLWKQSIRARDALAQGAPVIRDLSFRQRFVLKRWWHGALETIDLIERRKFDVWQHTPTLPFFRRMQVYLQTLFGKAATRT